MKTLYLHIGTSKTGSSAIQKFCADNAEVLEKKGYCYQMLPYIYKDHASKRRNAHFLIGKLYDEEGRLDVKRKSERVSEGLKTVAGWFREFDHVILTDESLWNGFRGNKIKLLRRVKEFCQEQAIELKLIVYLRRQDEFLYSLWKQRIRTGKKLGPLAEYVQNPPNDIVLDYDQQLQRMEEIVGQDNIIVRRYERKSFRGVNHTIYSDFLEALGLSFSEDFVVEQEIVNSSIDDSYIEIKRILNRLQEEDALVNNDVSRYFEKAALLCTKAGGNTSHKNLLTPDQQQKLLARYAEGNQRIVEKYFPGEDVLFHYEIPETPEGERDNQKIYEDIILFFGELSLRQNQETAYLKEQLLETKKELKLYEKQNQTELKALRMMMAPAKRIWRSVHKAADKSDDK